MTVPEIATAEWMAHREKIYAERNRRVREVCKRYPDIYRQACMKLNRVLWVSFPVNLCCKQPNRTKAHCHCQSRA